MSRTQRDMKSMLQISSLGVDGAKRTFLLPDGDTNDDETPRSGQEDDQKNLTAAFANQED